MCESKFTLAIIKKPPPKFLVYLEEMLALQSQRNHKAFRKIKHVVALTSIPFSKIPHIIFIFI
jgi:hypothetical protein